MKSIISIILLLISTISIKAQSPESFSYQAVVRDAENKLITNRDIGVKITILKGAVDGVVVYNELHTVNSNANGLITLAVGAGSTSDNFSAISWGSDNYFIETALDLTGGTNYTLTTTSQLLSVPYALYAKSSGSIGGLNVDAKISDLVLNSELNANQGRIEVDIKNGTPPYRVYIFQDEEIDIYAYINDTYYEYRISGEDGNYYDPSKAVIIKVKDSQGLVFDDYIFGAESYNGPVISIKSIIPVCAGQTNGAIDINIIGGTPPYDVEWTNWDTNETYNTEDISGVGSGRIGIKVKDSEGVYGLLIRNRSNGGEGEGADQIVIPSYSPYYTYRINESTTGNDGSIQLTIPESEPNQPFTYEWSDDYETSNIIAQTKDINNLSPGDYFVRLTNNQGCRSEFKLISFEGNEPMPEPDTTKPDIDIITPTAGQTYGISDGGSLIYEGNFTDDTELDKVIFSLTHHKSATITRLKSSTGIDDDPWVPTDHIITLSGKSRYINQNIFTNPSEPIWPGDYTLTITCFDRAGNTQIVSVDIDIE